VSTARELLALLSRDLPLKPASLPELLSLLLALISRVAARDTLDPSPCATRSGLAALTSLALLSSLALLFLAVGKRGSSELLFPRLLSLAGGLLAALSSADTIVSEAAMDRAGELSSRRPLLTPDGPAAGCSSDSSCHSLAAAGVWTGGAFTGRLLACCCLCFGVEVFSLPPPAAPFLVQAVPLVSPANISPIYRGLRVTKRSVP
jgi:hypothetical protein